MRLWLRLIGTGTDEDPYRRELPNDPRLDGVRVTTVGEGFTVEDPASPRYGHPLGSEEEFGGLILVQTDSNAQDVVDAFRPFSIPDESVPEGLRFCCTIIESLERDPADPRFVDGGHARAAFTSYATMGLRSRGVVRQQIIARALKEAADRGLRAEDVTSIGRDHGIA